MMEKYTRSILDGNGFGLRIDQVAETLSGHPTTVPLAERLRALQARLKDGRLHLAVLGQFKRGKSTVLNALLGEPFLPTAAVPVTAIPTLIEYGPSRQIRIVFQDGRRQEMDPAVLEDYVTEAGNPGNEKDVVRVEVTHPASLLARGVVLIDTPGIGSTLEHNTETTLNYLAEVDAALFLVSADPPITAAELDFLRKVQKRVVRLFFLLNKIDYLDPGERTAVMEFLAETLRTRANLDHDFPIYPVSARLGLEARQQNDEAGWQASGMAAVEAQLSRFLQDEKQATLQTAMTGKVADMLQVASDLVRMELQALSMPLDELRQKHELFQDALIDARRRRQQAADLLAGDRIRVLEMLNGRAATLRQDAQAALESAALAALDETDDLVAAETLARQRLAETVEYFFEQHQPSFTTAISQEVTALLASHAEQANARVEAMRRRAADLFALHLAPVSPHEVPHHPRQAYWVHSSQMGSLMLPVVPGFVDRLLSARQRRQKVVARLQPTARELALHNTENLRWATHQNVDQIFRQFQAQLDERWRETIEVTEMAIEKALNRREQQSEEVAPALQQLQDLDIHIQAALQEVVE